MKYVLFLLAQQGIELDYKRRQKLKKMPDAYVGEVLVPKFQKAAAIYNRQNAPKEAETPEKKATYKQLKHCFNLRQKMDKSLTAEDIMKLRSLTISEMREATAILERELADYEDYRNRTPKWRMVRGFVNSAVVAAGQAWRDAQVALRARAAVVYSNDLPPCYLT